jgi:hypothetical protein
MAFWVAKEAGIEVQSKMHLPGVPRHVADAGQVYVSHDHFINMTGAMAASELMALCLLCSAGVKLINTTAVTPTSWHASFTALVHFSLNHFSFCRICISKAEKMALLHSFLYLKKESLTLFHEHWVA